MTRPDQGTVRAAAAVSALVLALLASPAATHAAGDQGLQGGWAVSDSGYVSFPHSTYLQLPMMQEAGARWVRINFRLGACFTNWTTTESGKNCRPDRKPARDVYDEVVSEAEKRGLKVLALLSNEAWHGDQNQWNANNSENTTGNGYNSYVGNFVNYAVKPLASKFRSRITEWEVWNEPNSWWYNNGTEYSGGSYMYPSNYAQLLKRSRDALRSSNSNNRVIFGGLLAHDAAAVQATTVDEGGRVRRVNKRADMPVPHPEPANELPDQADSRADQSGGRPDPSNTEASGQATAAALPCSDPVGESGASYLRATYRVGRNRAGWRAGDYPLHHVGQHLYLDQWGAVSQCKIRNYVQDLRNALFQYEGSATAKKIQITEFGWETKDVITPEQQAANLSASYDEFRLGSRPNVSRAYWFNIQDIWYAGLFYGLRTSGDDTDGYRGSAKPAFGAYETSAAY
jgi:hypothetical protein